MGHEYDIECQCHAEAEEREPCAPARAVGEFIPYREVVEDTEEELAKHYQGHYRQTAEIARVDEIFHNVEVIHHPEENQQGEGHEICHGVAVGLKFLLTLVFAAREDKGLVGKAEGLQEYQQEHGYLIVGTVDSETEESLVGVGHKVRIEYLVDGLVHYAGHAENEQRQRVYHHLAPQTAVEAPAEAAHVGYEH